MDDMASLFAELRGILQSSHKPTPERLLALMKLACDMDSARYEAQWKPYLASFELPTFKIWRWPDVFDSMSLLPTNAPVLFGYPSYGPYQSTDVEWSWLLKQTTHLRIQHQKRDKSFYQKRFSKPFERLKALEIWSSEASHHELSFVVSSGVLDQLEHLCVHSNKLTDTFVLQLIDHGSAQLRYLNLSANHITDHGLNALLASNQFPNLTHLYVYEHPFDADVPSRLASRAGLPSLQDFGYIYPEA